MVKNLMLHGNISGVVEKDIYGNQSTPFRPVTRKPVVPSEPRSGKTAGPGAQNSG